MSYRAARRIQILLMAWLTLGFVTAWLPLLRGAMDGPSYEWGDSLFGWQFSGAGTGGDYAYVAAKAALAVAFLWFGWRRPNGLFRPALVAWLALSGGACLLERLGALSVMTGKVLQRSVSPPYAPASLIYQMEALGVRSLPIALLIRDAAGDFFRVEHANDAQVHPINPDHLAHRVGGIREDFVADRLAQHADLGVCEWFLRLGWLRQLTQVGQLGQPR